MEYEREQISIRLSSDMLEAFRETGPGWQTRLDAVLIKYVAKSKPAKKPK